MTGITGVQNAVTSGFGDVATQLCGGFAGVNASINGAQNAAVLACEMLALTDPALAERMRAYKQGLAQKIVKANEELSKVEYKFKV